MVKKLLPLILFLACVCNAGAEWKFNPFTSKLDFYDGDTANIQSYTISFATYSGTGIDFNAYENSTFTATGQLQEAINSASPGDFISIRPGTYVWTSSVTVDVADLTINFNGSVWTPDDNRPGAGPTVHENSFIELSAENIVIKNLYCSGKDQGMCAIYMDANADYWKVQNCTFFETGYNGGTSYVIRPVSGADYGQCFNVQFRECNAVGIAEISSSYGSYLNFLAVDGVPGSLIVYGTYNKFSNFQLKNSGRLSIQGDYNSLNGFMGVSSTVEGFYFYYSDWCTVSNGQVLTTTKDGMYFNHSDNNVVSNVVFKNINGDDAIFIDGSSDGNSITNCTFNATIDDYCVQIAAGATDNIISNCIADGVTGELGFIADNSGNSTNQYTDNLSEGDANYQNRLIEDTTFYGDISMYKSLTSKYGIESSTGNFTTSLETASFTITNQYTLPTTKGSDDQILKFNGEDLNWEADASSAGGAASIDISVDAASIADPIDSVDFENVFNAVAKGTTVHMFVSTAAPTNGDTTHLSNADQIYDFCETTQNYYKSGEEGTIAAAIAEGELADSIVVSADIKDGVVSLADMTAAATGYGTNWANFTNVPAGFADGTDDGGSEVSVFLRPQQAKLPTSNPAVIDAGNNGWRLLFDDTTQETATWEFIMDDDYGGGQLYCDVYFSMASGESDEVQWECYTMAYTPATDSADYDTDSYDTPDVSTTTVAASAGRVYKQTIIMDSDDSVAAGDIVRIKISTDSDDGTHDDATGDREFRYAVIRE